MTKGTQLWPNERMRDFFLAHIRRETALDEAAASQLTEALLKAVNRMLVWDMPEPVAAKPAPVVPAVPAPAKQKAKGGEGKAPEPKASEPKASEPKRPAAVASPATAGHPSSDAKVGGGAKNGFDPYAFSATVVLAKTGREGLMKRLAGIKSAENLKAFAEAQHLGIDRKLSKADELRKAILAATEQRLADRRAAAS